MPNLPPLQELSNPNEVLKILNKISLLGGLNQEQLTKVLALLKTCTIPKDHYIFNTGDNPKNIYIIQKGSVEIILDGEHVHLTQARFSQGNCFGETALIGIQPHSASALTCEETELIVLSQSALMSLHQEDAELFAHIILNIAREACRRLSHSNQTLLRYFDEKTS